MDQVRVVSAERHNCGLNAGPTEQSAARAGESRPAADVRNTTGACKPLSGKSLLWILSDHVGWCDTIQISAYRLEYEVALLVMSKLVHSSSGE